MRKLKLQVQLTIDGYMAGVNGELSWMVWDWDDALKQYVEEITEPVDCIILGRKLAERFIPHWASNPNEEGAAKFNNTPKVVFTNKLSESVWDNTVLAKGNLEEEINKLKSQEGKDIIAYGGASFVSALIKHKLIDEYHLFINPTAIGNGMPVFKEVDGKLDFTLVKGSSFDCGIVALHYKQKQ